MDCSGECYGSALVDECGVCAGDSSSCNMPVASDFTIEVNEDGSIEITLSAVDPNQDPLTFEVTAGPESGSLEGDAPSLVYTPSADFNGQDSFTYTASDGE